MTIEKRYEGLNVVKPKQNSKKTQRRINQLEQENLELKSQILELKSELQ